jgi:hypothetical protein
VWAAEVAQLVEQLIRNQQVVGPSPIFGFKTLSQIKHMTHRKMYSWLLAANREAALLKTIADQGYQKSLGYTNACVIRDKHLSYIRFLIPRNLDHAAHSGGIYIHLHDFPELNYPDRFYLPILALVNPKDKIALAHELLHISDLLQRVEEDPGYPAIAMRMASYEATDDSDLEERIEFELRKVLAMETRAFQLEYKLGVRKIAVPFIHGKSYPVTCASEQEFVQFWLAEYIHRTESTFLQRFPQHAERILAAVKTLTNQYGQDLFGATAYETAKQRKSEVLRGLFLQVFGVTGVRIKS